MIRIKLQRGSSTVEMLIAMAILVISLTAVIVTSFGNQTLATDAQTNSEALVGASNRLEATRDLAIANFLAVVPTTTAAISPNIYNEETEVVDESPCLKKVTSIFDWSMEGRPQESGLSSYLTSTSTAIALGGDCEADPDNDDKETWSNPQCLGSADTKPGGIKPTRLDVLDKIVYFGESSPPYFGIMDASSIDPANPPPQNPTPVDFINGFDAKSAVNDVDVARYSNGQIYAFIVRDTDENNNPPPFAVVNFYDGMNKPAILNSASGTLANVSPTKKSIPKAFRVYYYGGKVYVTIQYFGSATPEFHIFDVSDPDHPSEIGGGTKLRADGTADGTSVYDISIIPATDSYGNKHLLAYLATTYDDKELQIYDVTDPSDIKFVISNGFTGGGDGRALYLLGNKLYIGLSSSSNDDLYVLDASNPLLPSAHNPPVFISADIGNNTLALTASGKYLFMITDKKNNEFQVRRSGPNDITQLSIYNFPNIGSDLDYENKVVYIASAAQDAIRILYDAPPSHPHNDCKK